MDLRHLFQSPRVEDRRDSNPFSPAFNYANPFRTTQTYGDMHDDARAAETPTGLSAQAGAGDMSQLVQMLLTQRALRALELRGQLPSYDWHYNAPLPRQQGTSNVDEDQSPPVGPRR